MIGLAHRFLFVPVRAIVMAVSTLSIPGAYGQPPVDHVPTVDAVARPTALRGSSHLILTSESDTSFDVAIPGGRR